MTNLENDSYYANFNLQPLENRFNNGEAIAHIWTIEDVMSLDDTLTKDEAMDVLQLVIDNLDSNIGINWNVIENALHYVKQQKEPLFL